MNCEVAKSPFSEPGFPGPFDNIRDDHSRPNDVDLSAISNFNANLNGVNQDCIDPQSLSYASSPTSTFDPTPAPEHTASAYPTEFDNISQAPSPYFQSIEPTFGASFILPAAQSFHHLHRRSVSEPPDGALMHRPTPHSAAPMIFHRDGHKLGVPCNPEAAWSNKKAKNSRAKPYQQRNSPRGPAPQPIQSRYMLRRPGAPIQAQQPTHHLLPTSVPHDLPPNHSMHHSPLPPNDHLPQSSQPQYVSSRLCTPAPEAVDPFLSLASSVPGPMVAPMPGGIAGFPLKQGQTATAAFDPVPANKNLTMLKMGAEELRALIADAVREAVGGLQAQQTSGKGDCEDQEVVGIVSGVNQPVVANEDDGGDGEEIVIAGKVGISSEAVDNDGKGEGGEPKLNTT